MTADPFAALCEAVAVYQDWRGDPQRCSSAALLDAHPALRELLEPMLDENGAEQTSADVHEDLRRRVGSGDSTFELVREVGRGGMGIVHEAVQLSLDRRVAVKELIDPGFGIHPQAITRFRREATAAGRLQHEGLVEVYAVGGSGAQDDAHWFAMEFVRGAPLDAVLAALRELSIGSDRIDGVTIGRIVRNHCILPENERPSSDPPGPQWQTGANRVWAELAMQIAEALECAHRQRIVHRDVKPSNILIRPDGRTVLTDFGLSRNADAPDVSIDGSFSGTPGYCSPEQIDGTRADIDQRTDIFSLGVTLYEALTQRRPWAAASTRDEMRQAVRIEPERPDHSNPRVPRDLAAIVMRCLEKEPARRYASAAALAADLRAFLAFEPVDARHIGRIGRTLRWARREPAIAALALGASLALPIGAGSWLYLRDQQHLIDRGSAAQRAEAVQDGITAGFHAMIARGDNAASERAFGAVLDIEPQNATATAGRILLAIRERRLHDAEGILHELPETLASTPALQRLGRRLRSGLTRPSNDDDPGDLLDCLVAGMLAYEDAIYGARIVDGDRAFRLLDRACQLAPQRQQFLLCLRAESACWLADPRFALDAERSLARLWPDSDDVKLQRARALQNAAPQRALQLFEELLASPRRDAVTLRSAATLLLDNGEVERAATLVAEARRLAPDSPDVLATAAEVRRRQGDNAGAATILEGLAARLPRRGILHYNLGVAYRDDGRIRSAIAAFESCLNLDPRDVGAAREIARLEHRLDNLDNAITAMRTAVQLDPEHLPSRNDLAVMLIQAGRSTEALDAFKALLQRTPNDVAARRNYAICLRDSGDKAGANRELNRCIAIEPTWRDSYLTLSSFLTLDGRLLDAAAVARDMLTAAGYAAKGSDEASKAQTK